MQPGLPGEGLTWFGAYQTAGLLLPSVAVERCLVGASGEA